MFGTGSGQGGKDVAVAKAQQTKVSAAIVCFLRPSSCPLIYESRPLVAHSSCTFGFKEC